MKPSYTRKVEKIFYNTRELKLYSEQSDTPETPSGTVTIAAAIVDRRKTGVTSITANDLTGATRIGDYAFYNCRYLTEVEIPDTVTEIANQAFYGCAKLTSLIIPERVGTIGTRALGNTAFKELIFLGTEPPTLSGSGNIYSSATIYVPYGCGDIYSSATNWGSYYIVELNEDGTKPY